jgi:hypothetical protein
VPAKRTPESAWHGDTGGRGDPSRPSREEAGQTEGLGAAGANAVRLGDRAAWDTTGGAPALLHQAAAERWWGRVVGDAPTITTRASGTRIILLMFAGRGVERLWEKVGSALCRMKENQKENPKKKIATERFPFCSNVSKVLTRRRRGHESHLTSYKRLRGPPGRGPKPPDSPPHQITSRDR